MIRAEVFWDYSLQVYANEAVQANLLKLQDRYSLNVNLLLMAMYCERHNINLSEEMIRTILSAIAKSENELSLFRQNRRAAKTGNQEEYKALLAQELALEKTQQTLLVDTINAIVESDQLSNMTSTKADNNLIVYANFISDCSTDRTLQALLRELEHYV